MKLRALFALPAVSLVLAVLPAKADLVGSQVTGAFLISGNNYFDPANGYVNGPNGSFPGGSLNASGTTVNISSSAVEFGFMDGANTISGDFSGTGLTVTDVVNTGAASEVNWSMTYTDPAFSSLSKVSDTFVDGGLSDSLSGDTITLTFAGGTVPSPGILAATFNINVAGPASAPETTTTLGLFGLALLSLAGLKRFKYSAV